MRLAAPLMSFVFLAAAGLFLAQPSAAVPPEVTPELPLPGTYFNLSGAAEHAGRALVQATAMVTDPDTPELNLTVTFTLNPPLEVVAPGEVYSLTFSPNSTAGVRAVLEVWLPPGVYTLTWTAVDEEGNSTSADTTLSVDLEGPRVHVVAPATANASVAWATIDVLDAISGVDTSDVHVLFRSACNTSWAEVPASLAALGGHIVGEVELHLCEGRDNVLQVAATDRAGHGNSSGVLSITLDLYAPRVSSHQPASFTTADGPLVQISAIITDSGTDVNLSTVEVQVSPDGGRTWGQWAKPTTRSTFSSWVATYNATLAPGASGAVRWRAYDNAGNGPGEQLVVHFTVNGPPFLISYSPEEKTQELEGRELTFSARFADPDADIVHATFTSDIDGYLGEVTGRHEIEPEGESFTRELSIGVHNITIVGDDGHGNRKTVVYTVTITARPPPDLRPFAVIPLMGLALLAASWLAWRRAEELDEGEEA